MNKATVDDPIQRSQTSAKPPTKGKPGSKLLRRLTGGKKRRGRFPRGGDSMPFTRGEDKPIRVDAVQEKVSPDGRITRVLHPSSRGKPLRPDKLVALATRNRRRGR